MNKEILKLEDMLTKGGVPFYFIYREENRPAPFGAVQVDMENDALFIAVGPAVNCEAVCASPAGAGDDDLLKVVLPGGSEQNEAVAADVAFTMIKDEFLKNRAEWWPEVYGTEK